MPTSILRVVAVLGLCAILLLGSWGIIQIAFAIGGFFSPGITAPSSNTSNIG